MKKTVEFTEFLGWQEHPSGAVQALLGGVIGHPLLGDEEKVVTSAVVRIKYAPPREPVEIETLNTIYKKAKEDEDVRISDTA